MSSPIDCTGLACPEPVLRVKEALDSFDEGVVTIIVDNTAARENVTRFAKNQGATVTVASEGDKFKLTIAKGFLCQLDDKDSAEASSAQELPTAFLFLSDTFGEDEKLGEVLMKAFITTLPKATTPPAKLIFMNSAVLLTTVGSELVEELATLDKMGVEVLSCGTCLDYFNKKDSLLVGRVTNVYDTLETLTSQYRVVTIT